MAAEVLVEEGIVVSVEKGTANVAITQSKNCEDCTAKIICKPKSETENVITVENSFGLRQGDKVKIEVEGSVLLNATFFLYGIPIILIFAGIIFGMSIFSDYTAKELYSFFFGIGLVAIYYTLTFFNRSAAKQKLPKIVSINRNN